MPFEVPEGWRWTTIEDLLINRDSERIPLSLAVRNKQHKKEYNYYGAAGVIDKVEGYLFSERLLLIGEDGANLLSRAKDNAFFADGKYWVNNHAHVLDCSEKEVLTYVALVINSMALDPYVTGSAQPKLSQDNLNKILIPLPPLAEQRRIIYAINNYSVYLSNIENDKKSIENIIDLLKQLILNLAISGKLVSQELNDEPAIELLKRINPSFVPADNRHYENVPYEVPESWQWVKLKDLCVFLSRGKSPVYSETDKRYPVFAQKCNLKGGGISLKEARFLEPSTISKWKDVYKLQDGDILINSTGTGTVCRTRLFKSEYLCDYPFVVPDSHVSVIRTYEQISSEYAYLVLSSKFSQDYMMDNLAGSTNQKELYISVLENLLFPLPPLGEQMRIVKCVNKIYTQLEQISSEL